MGVFTEVLEEHKLIQNRIQHSKQFLSKTVSAFEEFDGGKNKRVCVFAAGSLGRFETGQISDLDLFIVSNEKISKLEEYKLFSDLIRLNEYLELPEFSSDGKFLKVHHLDDLIKATGDDKDDLENQFTTRLLLLLESKPISNVDLYNQSLNQVLGNYFRDSSDKKDFQPLFLLNDMLRYWRTLCLNYERDRGNAKPWWKKNLNLKFSRKLTVFSTVLAILSRQVSTSEDLVNFTQNVPLERLALSLDQINDLSLLGLFSKALDDYESFLAAKSHSDLEIKEEGVIDDYRLKADQFGEFIYSALHSDKLDKKLVRFLAI
jgi:predicted nucleotidyltransferase